MAAMEEGRSTTSEAMAVRRGKEHSSWSMLQGKSATPARIAVAGSGLTTIAETQPSLAGAEVEERREVEVKGEEEDAGDGHERHPVHQPPQITHRAYVDLLI